MARVRLLAGLREAIGKGEIIINGDTLSSVIRELIERYPELSRAVDPKSLEPGAGYIVFVDGIDIRLTHKDSKVEEIIILPVNHGGEVPEKLEVEKISWKEIDIIIDDISQKIETSGFKPDAIVAIIRGGLVPARLLSDSLGIDDILTMEIKLYEGIGVRGKRPFLRQPLTGEVQGRRLLLVDDISDTGLTLQLAQEVISFYMPAEVKTASLYIKPWTNFVPDFYSRTTDKWVVFPWEKKEFERLSEET